MNKALFTSNKRDWETPPEVFEPLSREFSFTLDVCATAENAKVERYFSPENDSLKQDWGRERCFMNPPYGREIGKWVKKAYEESQKGALVVALLPARTDTRWFHDWVLGKAEIRFTKGRIRFVGAESSAPFPSLIAIYRPMMGWVIGDEKLGNHFGMTD